ncbi:MAG: PorP/SprF family type IX secretion system membrane protein [Bacteroidota bacterium]
MKKLTLIILTAFIANYTFGQEEAIYSHVFINTALINPATVGIDRDHHNVFMNVRTAFTSFPETPRTYALSYNGAFGKQVGLGAMLFSENVADINQFRMQLSYSMGFQVEDLALRAGLSLEYNTTDLNNATITGDFYETGDEVIERAMEGEDIFDTSLGLHATYKNVIHFGYTAPNLIRTVLDDIEGLDEGGNFKYYIFHAGGDFDLKDYKIRLRPSVVYKKVRNVDPHVNVNLVASFLKEQLITGLTFRSGTGSTLGFILGTKYNTVQFVYSYDVYMDDFQQYNGGSHEITVGFAFNRNNGKFDRSKKYRK